jgi:arylsulfatase A-like enzyme
MMRLNMPPMLEVGVEAALWQLGLGAVLGLLLSPLRLVWRGGIVHTLAVAAAWIALARYVALDPANTPSWLMSPAVGLGLFVAGAILARRSRVLAWGLGVLMLGGAVSMPKLMAAEGEGPAAAMPSGVAPAGAPDVVLVVLDTVRAANMSAYGYGRETTPTFARLAGEGALFLDATAPSTWSLPSHASLFTGLFPSGHGAHEESRVLAPDVPTVAQVLGDNGYETLCFTANPHISDSFGLTRGFQKQDRAWLGPSAGRSFQFIFRVLDVVGWSNEDKGGGHVVDNFERWLATRSPDSPPAFAFLNFLEAHFPYHQTPPRFLARFTQLGGLERREVSLKAMAAQFGRRLSEEEIAAIAEPARDMYDAGIAYADFLLERVVDAVAEAGRLDRTLLVVVSDHGEMIGEHGEFGHGAALYEPDLRVPLLLRYPGAVAAGERVARPVSTVGIYATILDLVGLVAPRKPHVASLLPLLHGGVGGEPVLAERFAMPDTPPNPNAAPLARRDTRYRVYRRDTMKLAMTPDGEFLFDLAKDPGETGDVAGVDDGSAAPVGPNLHEELRTWVSALGLPALDADQPGVRLRATPIDPAAEQRLRSLGYLE